MIDGGASAQSFEEQFRGRAARGRSPTDAQQAADAALNRAPGAPLSHGKCRLAIWTGSKSCIGIGARNGSLPAYSPGSIRHRFSPSTLFSCCADLNGRRLKDGCASCRDRHVYTNLCGVTSRPPVSRPRLASDCESQSDTAAAWVDCHFWQRSVRAVDCPGAPVEVIQTVVPTTAPRPQYAYKGRCRGDATLLCLRTSMCSQMHRDESVLTVHRRSLLKAVSASAGSTLR